MHIFKLDPVLKEYDWGGYHLSQDYKKTAGFARIGESWELACREGASCTIADPRYGKQTLLSYLYENGDHTLGNNCASFSSFPFELRLVDTAMTPSIHIHPTCSGRTQRGHRENAEILHIISCAQDACLFLGLKRALTKRELKKAVEQNDIEPLLNKVLAQPGDMYYIPPGMLHGLGAGILAAQVISTRQETFRVKACPCSADVAPLDAAELEQALDHACTEPGLAFKPNKEKPLVCKDYQVETRHINGHHVNEANRSSCIVFTVLNGGGTLRGNDTFIPFNSADTLFLGAGSGTVAIEGICDLLVASIPKPEPKPWFSFLYST